MYGKTAIRVSLKAYKKEKLKILRQMYIKLSANEEAYLMSLEREIDVDNFVHSLIMDRL